MPSVTSTDDPQRNAAKTSPLMTSPTSSHSLAGDNSFQPETVEALELTAAGHAARGGTNLKQAVTGGKPRTILKLYDKTEHEVYRKFRAHPDDPIAPHVPKFDGVAKNVDKSHPEANYLRIANVLMEFVRPKVIDVKLGVRTFLESECTNTKPRSDLFRRMLDIYPDEATSEEVAAGSITKHRWMTLRDQKTTIGNLCYRIDGIAGLKDITKKEMDLELSGLNTLEDTVVRFKDFCDIVACDGGEAPICHPPSVIAERLLAQLKAVQKGMEASAIVKEHEFIGTSLLLCADETGQTGVNWIDFAKTHAVPPGMAITHRKPWELGNLEDGLLIGVDFMVKAWELTVAELRATPEELMQPETPGTCLDDTALLHPDGFAPASGIASPISRSSSSTGQEEGVSTGYGTEPVIPNSVDSDYCVKANGSKISTCSNRSMSRSSRRASSKKLSMSMGASVAAPSRLTANTIGQESDEGVVSNEENPSDVNTLMQLSCFWKGEDDEYEEMGHSKSQAPLMDENAGGEGSDMIRLPSMLFNESSDPRPSALERLETCTEGKASVTSLRSSMSSIRAQATTFRTWIYSRLFSRRSQPVKDEAPVAVVSPAGPDSTDSQSPKGATGWFNN